MLQTILIIVAVIIVVPLLLALVMEKKYSITSEVIINKPRATVFEYVKFIKNQAYYSKWVMADPNVAMDYKGVDGTVGFVSAWKSDMKNVGIGEQEITKITEGDGYDVEVRFKKPFEGVSTANVTTQAISDTETKLITTFYTQNPYPLNIMIPIIKKMLKKDMDENSANLKKVLEA